MGWTVLVGGGGGRSVHSPRSLNIQRREPEKHAGENNNKKKLGAIVRTMTFVLLRGCVGISCSFSRQGAKGWKAEELPYPDT